MLSGSREKPTVITEHDVLSFRKRREEERSGQRCKLHVLQMDRYRKERNAVFPGATSCIAIHLI